MSKVQDLVRRVYATRPATILDSRSTHHREHYDRPRRSADHTWVFIAAMLCQKHMSLMMRRALTSPERTLLSLR